MNQMYLYKSVAKTISYDDTHWYLNGVPKRIEGDDSPERIKQFAIDEAYKAAAEEISLYSVHFKNVAVLTAAGTSMENGSNGGKTRNELWETNKSEIDFIKDKLCVEEGFLKEKCKKIIEEKNIEEFLSLVILYEKLNGEIKDSDGIFVRNKLEQNIANACPAGNHFPMQKCSKIFPSTSSVVTSPRMVPRWWRAWRRSSERRSGVWPAARERLTFSRDSDAFIRAW